MRLETLVERGCGVMVVVGGIPNKILIVTDRAHVEEDTAYASLRARQTLWREPFVRGHAPPRWGLMSRGQRGITIHRVLPQDVNHLGTLFGGRLLEWMDGAAEIVAARYAQRVVVTVAMEQVTFTQSVQVGDLVRIGAAIDRIGRTSLGVQVTAWRESLDGAAVVACAARLTFVALDDTGRPVSVRETPQRAAAAGQGMEPAPSSTVRSQRERTDSE